ncbi:PQQ-binding-like beta-propeller repeat protein [Nocardioides humilatus]|uniref:PQQ-binding-like beta-propeller repeat protein n=1 Tax=Nocardioides humilatus TaxID=2607660 RepID=A0A5B1LDU4_9ACTN|nr:BTAD domain-containing putative transcriptional regulator [Nocardioides humilatus]KAA1418616.1 PQQ-binding-like beta-propeller repeat protein [Nocardioides humilatus]
MVVQPYVDRVEFQVLGPLRVLTPEGPVEIRGAKERLLLGHLIARAGKVVASSELVDGLWGDDPPRTAAKSLQTYVLRLRNALEPDRAGEPSLLVTEGQGYRLAIHSVQVDADRFTRLLAAARDGSAHERLERLGEALGLWRGTAYADLAADPVLAGESTRLEALRWSAVEDKLDLELRAGLIGTAVADLERWVLEAPERERLWALLMHGLFLQGRQADALAAYERARQWLAEEIGVDPSAELRQMHARVLAQDPALAPRDRAAATAAVSAAVDEADRSRTDLRDAQTRIATGILDLRQAASAVPPPADRSPWPGLNAYDVDDGPWFAGRERLVAELLARTAGTRCLAVVGASGSGKSSAVRAGLVAGLADGQLPGSAAWETVVLRPGQHPMRELTRHFLSRQRAELGAVLERLVRAPEGTSDRTILVIDQCEEVWTACTDEGERGTFLDTLGALAVDPDNGITLVLVIRADYLADLADARPLAALVENDTVLVGAPSVDDVRRAVTLPAARAGMTFDDGLVDAIVADAGAEPGLLPLLSTALAQLWEERQGHHLTLESYVRLGGLDSAIRHLAETAYGDLEPTAQETMRAVLLRLAGPGDADVATRRRASVAELVSLPHAEVPAVLDRLTGARLVTRDGDVVEVAHEALFREWPRLRDWLREDADGRALRVRLATAAAEWESEGREVALLWTGSRLAAAAEIADDDLESLTGLEREFLAAGRAEADAARIAAEERARSKARQNRRLRVLLVGVLVLLVLAVAAGAIALNARDRAEESAREASDAAVAADAKRLAASALSIEYPDLALLAAVEATSLEQSPETYGALLTLLSRQPEVITRYRIEDRFLRNAATPNGRVVVLSDNVGVLRGLDGSTGKLLWEREDLAADIGHVAMSPDGSVLAATLWAEHSRVEGFDPVTGDTLWQLPLARAQRLAGRGAAPYLWSYLSWTADRRLVFASDTHLFVADVDGRLLHAVPWGRPMREVPTMYVWPDGKVSVGTDDFRSGFVIGPVTGGTHGRTTRIDGIVASVSPDGRRAVLGTDTPEGPQVELVSARDFTPLSGTIALDAGVLLDVDFSPDGRRVAVATDDEDVVILDGRTGGRSGVLSGHSGSVLNLAWAGPGHSMLWTAGRDGTAVEFDVTGQGRVIRTQPSPDAPVAGESAGGVSVWSNFDPYAVNRAFLKTAIGRSRALPLDGLEACPCQVTSTELTPDGRMALGGYASFPPGEPPRADLGQVVVWDTSTSDVVEVVRTPAPVTALAVRRDGTSAVVVTVDGWTVLDLTSFELGDWTALAPIDPFAVTEATARAEIAPDGTRAALLRDNEVLLVDLATGDELASRSLGEGDDLALSAAWAADSSTLISGSLSGRVHVLDGSSLEPVRPTRLVTGGFVIDIEVSDDGSVAATMGTDGDVLLWDAHEWAPYGLPVLDHGEWGYLSFEGDRLRVDHQEGTRSSVSIDPAEWVEAACQAANRDLTEEEFAILLAGVDYHPTCSARD